MSANTMGQFIAALRKVSGLTQREVADKLGVSDKAVSRWERDECAPDISLIPAIAEMFGVTCDELLKGGRTSESAPLENTPRKTEKMLKSLVSRTLSGFKTQIFVSLAVSVAGLICMFGISYGFYRPVIGFAAMLVLEVCAFAVAAALNKARYVRNGSELFEEADDDTRENFDRTVGSCSFAAFFSSIAAVLLSLPIVIMSSDNYGVLSAKSYFLVFFLGTAVIPALIAVKCRKPYMDKISGKKRGETPKNKGKKIRLMNIIQIGLIAVVAAASFFAEHIGTAAGWIIISCIAAEIGALIFFAVKCGAERKNIILTGLRNILLVPSALTLSKIQTVVRFGEAGAEEKTVIWSREYLWFAIVSAALVSLIFAVIENLTAKKGR